MAEVGVYTVTVMPDMSKFNGALSRAAPSAGGFLSNILSTGLGVTLSNIVSGAFGAFMDGISSGINRLDTIESFQRVMVALGESPEAAAGSIDQMVSALDGLPTATNDMASWVQQIRSAGEPLDRATQLGIAMNDAMLAGGHSAADVANAMDAYNTILARGVPDLMHWRSLVTTSPAAIDQLAKSLLGADANQQDLYQAMQDGTVTMDDFNDALIQLNEEGVDGMANFEEQARAATGGIGTALENVQNRISKAWQVILDAIGSERISGLINGISSQFAPLAQMIAPYITAAADVFFDFVEQGKTAFGEFQTTIMPYIQDFVSGAQAAWQAFKDALQSDDIQGVIQRLSDAFASFSETLGPFYQEVLVPLGNAVFPAIGTALAFLGGVAIDVFSIFIELLTEVMETIQWWKDTITNGVAEVQSTFELFSTGMSELWTIITTAVSDAGNAIVTAVSTAWNTVTTTVSTFMETTKQRISDGWEQAKANASAKLDALKSKVQEAWDNIKSKVTEKVDSIKEKISSGFESAKNKVTEVFNTIKEKIVNPIKEAKDKITGFIDDISSAISGVHLELPSIRLPHFSVSGGTPPYGIAGMGSLPHFSVSWYAQGGIIDKAMLFGAGEKGAELIWPSYSPYLERYADAIASRMGGAGSTNVYIDGSIAATDARLSALLGEVVNYVIGTYAMGRA